MGWHTKQKGNVICVRWEIFTFSIENGFNSYTITIFNELYWTNEQNSVCHSIKFPKIISTFSLLSSHINLIDDFSFPKPIETICLCIWLNVCVYEYNADECRPVKDYTSVLFPYIWSAYALVRREQIQKTMWWSMLIGYNKHMSVMCQQYISNRNGCV